MVQLTAIQFINKNMKIVKDKIEIAELKEMAKKMFGDLVKAVVDIEKEIMAIDAPLHADLMEHLIEQESSEPQYLWGVNFYPEIKGSDFVEFDSMINLKPDLGNKTRGVESRKIQGKIIEITRKLIKK
jgi:hypothetical protein